jgi:hypothetical protein
LSRPYKYFAASTIASKAEINESSQRWKRLLEVGGKSQFIAKHRPAWQEASQEELWKQTLRGEINLLRKLTDGTKPTDNSKSQDRNPAVSAPMLL